MIYYSGATRKKKGGKKNLSVPEEGMNLIKI